jgi:hypothetical protein
MKVALLDVNVLLALAWPNHQHHASAHEWFARENRHGWATCALTQLSFVRLSSNPAYTPAAVTPSEAGQLLRKLAAHRTHRYWATMPQPERAMFAHALGHRQVQDAYMVHLAEQQRGRLVTFDRRVIVHAADAGSVHVISAEAGLGS